MRFSSQKNEPLMRQRWMWHQSSRSFERTYLFNDHVRRDSFSWRGFRSETIPMADIRHTDVVPGGYRGRSLLGLHRHKSDLVLLAVRPAFVWHQKIKSLKRLPKWRPVATLVAMH